MNEIQCTLFLDDNQALALAQLCKRIGWTELRALAGTDLEAQSMREAINRLSQGLAEQGYAPR